MTMTPTPPSEPQEPYPPNDPTRPRDPYYGPWYRRYWTYSNRPYGGCGCLYAILIFLLIWWLLAWFIPEIALWNLYF